jgi:formate dehydrogenase subunit gamma
MGVVSIYLMGICLLLFSSLVDAEQRSMPTVQQMNPSAELWNGVRQRSAPVSGKTQVKGVESGVLINTSGDRWRHFRISQLIPISGYIVSGMILALVAFYLIRGRVPIEGGMSDRKLLRYTSYERLIHWSLATIFLLLAITGLILLFGRSVLIPLFGKEIFSALASLSKQAHNFLGPLFLVALILMFFQFVRRNIYQKGDLTWLLRGGGIIGSKHVPSNFFNMGEKTMFWMLVFVGGLIGVSGLILDFPIFGQSREFMALTHVAHSIGAVLMTTVILGHIYIGSVGMEGALEGMKTGYCDLNWAKEHHDLWASKAEERGEAVSNEEVVASKDKQNPSSAQTLAQESGK